MAQARDVIIVIVDISGYTRFMVAHRKAQAHAEMIIGALLEALMGEVGECLEIAELEGDAIFMYAFKDAPESSTQRAVVLGQHLSAFFRVFSAVVADLGANAICKCPACANIGALRIKIVVHSGRVVISQLGKFTKLTGVDVITAHRLLKNSVNADEYVLLTDSAKADVVFAEELRFEPGEEQYDEIGTVRTHVALDLAGVLRGADQYAESLQGTSEVGYQIIRHEIRSEYTEVAIKPDQGFHFHTGRPLAQMLDYAADDITWIPDCSMASFAGTGNPLSVGEIREGDCVVDIGCGAGFDTLLAARRVGASGAVIGVDMTPEMIARAREGIAARQLSNVKIVEGYAESLPVEDEWADVIISNGVFNLCPNKPAVLREMYRVLKPGGRMQIGDILVQKAIPEEAKRDIDLWTG